MRTSTAAGVLLAAIGFVVALGTTVRADDGEGWRSHDRQWSDDRSDDQQVDDRADDGSWDGNRPDGDRWDGDHPQDDRWHGERHDGQHHDHPHDGRIIQRDNRHDPRQLDAAPRPQPIPPMRPYWGTMQPYWKPVDPGIKHRGNVMHPKSR